MGKSKLWLMRGLAVVLAATVAVAVMGCGSKKTEAPKNTGAPVQNATEPTENEEQQKEVNVAQVYWRQKKYLDSKNNTTLRKPDENGVYTAEFYCDGEIVAVQFKDKTLVETIDSLTNATCHFGFVFDDAGYAVEVISSADASNTLLQCERYDITEVNEDGSYKAAELIKYKGEKVVQGVIGEDCDIYDISAVAKAEEEANRKLDTVQVGDRVCIWTDKEGKPVLIYVTSRQPDSPLYFNPDPQYNTETKKTERKKNAKGYYEIELLVAGETELQTFYTRYEKIVNTIDKSADRCVGLKVVEGNIIQYVYDMESVLGQTYFCRGAEVTAADGVQIAIGEKSGVLSADCKIWNVSDTGEFGAETKLQVGDYIYAGRDPYSQIINVYVLSRA